MAIDLGRLRVVFLEEFEEHRTTLQSGLLELERDPAAADRLLPELFRAGHSLKGGAQAVRLPALASVCHRLEETLSALRDGTVALTPSVINSLLAEFDALVGLVAEFRAASAEDPSDVASPGAPAAAPPGPTGALTASPSPTSARPGLRVPAGRLDMVLDRAGDVLLARDRLASLARSHQELAATTTAIDRRWQEARSHLNGLPPLPAAAIAAADRAWQDTSSRFESLRANTAAAARLLHDAATGLEHTTRTLRLQPFRHACDGFDRAVRDLAHGAGTEGRRVALVVEGGDVELDSEVVSALREPLLHLVRNAVAHGIEPVDVRRDAGKPEFGTVTIRASVVGDQIQVSVADDGAGLDLARLRTEAAGRGLDVGEDDDAVSRLAWLPGLSTAESADELAGRGVGLDAVLSRIEGLGGTAELTSRDGRGCTVSLHAPVTLSTLHALMIQIGEQTVALPSGAIHRVVRLTPAAIRTTAAGPHALVDHELFRLVSLRSFFGLPPDTPGDHFLALLLNGPSGQAALVVDRISDARRITRRGVHPRLAGSAGIVGTTVLPTGAATLILNPVACLRQAGVGDVSPEATDTKAEVSVSRVLLVEDSPTTRALEQDILESAGYDVMIAADGEQAWRLLREHGADLVVTDVEMPRMDGFSLCRAIRDHPRLGALPVVLVTSRASDEDRHRGVEVGANAYLVKGAFDQTAFLATLERLL